MKAFLMNYVVPISLLILTALGLWSAFHPPQVLELNHVGDLEIPSEYLRRMSDDQEEPNDPIAPGVKTYSLSMICSLYCIDPVVEELGDTEDSEPEFGGPETHF